MTSPIAVRGLTKRFRSVTAVDDVSFDVPAGRITGLLGRNGAGKTTTLRAILGLTRPTSGDALIFGESFLERARPRRVGISIDGIGAVPGTRVLGELEIWARALHLGADAIEQVIESTGLREVTRRRVAHLSQGQRQRLSLAVAFLGDPEVLVLDEPTTGLDPDGIRWLRTALRARADRGATVLLSSHLLNEVEETVDDVIVLEQDLRFAGTVSDLTDHGRHRLEDRFFELVAPERQVQR